MNEQVPIEWIRGPDEVTVWMWPNSPDTITVRLSIHEWAKIERTARDHFDGDIEAFFTRVVTADLEEHREVLSE